MKTEGAPLLMEALAAKKSTIVATWMARTLGTYPEQTSRFLADERDPFRNPAGHTLQGGLPVLFDQLLRGMDADRVTRVLDRIVRIRAVQDFTAGQAVAFVFLLKPILREALKREIRGDAGGNGLAVVEDRIDQMALLAFDLFMQCRERIYEIRARETRRRVYVLMKRQGVEGRNGETENRGNGEAGLRLADPPVSRLSDSAIREWKKP